MEALTTGTRLLSRQGGHFPGDRKLARSRRARAGFLHRLETLGRPAIMGVLNVTPDSFSDGGRFFAPAAAAARARRMLAEGADLIDVGGESTRPGAAPVDEHEELRRVLPVIERLAGLGPISIDTTKAAVAAAALEAGATIVNDVSGALADPEMLSTVAERGAEIVLMHSKGTARTMQRLASYRDVVGEVKRFLAARAAAAIRAGIPRRKIAVDPGIGFAKSARHNLLLLARIGEIVELGLPVVVGVSRKSFLGRLLDLPVDQRIEGTIAASLLAAASGVRILRVHDVEPMSRALRVAAAVWKAAEG